MIRIDYLINKIIDDISLASICLDNNTKEEFDNSHLN